MDIGIGFVVQEGGSDSHGSQEAPDVDAFPILLDAFGAWGKWLHSGLRERERGNRVEYVNEKMIPGGWSSE